MGWEELQRELAEAFTTDGVIGKKILHLIEYEKKYGEFVERKFKGLSILSHCFMEFFAETVELAASVWQDEEKRPTPPTYSETVLWHLTNFRNLRAVEILFRNGYPMDGFARLRHLKESAIYLAAMLAGVTTYEKINGWEGVLSGGEAITEENMAAIRKNRKKEEFRVLNFMIRKNSGFPPEHLAELRRWESLFHEEVHGARLTLAFEHGPAAKGEDTTSIAPKPRINSIAMFVNRYCEVCWMLHRTLPILQLSRNLFDKGWQYRWNLLDKNFKLVVDEALVRPGKKLGIALIHLMDTKFAFSPADSFETTIIKDSQQDASADA